MRAKKQNRYTRQSFRLKCAHLGRQHLRAWSNVARRRQV